MEALYFYIHNNLELNKDQMWNQWTIWIDRLKSYFATVWNKTPSPLKSDSNTTHRCFCQFPVWLIYYYGSNKSTRKEIGKTHLCGLWCGWGTARFCLYLISLNTGLLFAVYCRVEDPILHKVSLRLDLVFFAEKSLKIAKSWSDKSHFASKHHNFANWHSKIILQWNYSELFWNVWEISSAFTWLHLLFAYIKYK